MRHASANEAVAAGARIVVNFSGGKDSVAMLAHIADAYPALVAEGRVSVVFANVGEGVEWPEVEEYGRRVCAKFGLGLEIVRPVFKGGGTKDFFSMVRARLASIKRNGKLDRRGNPASPIPSPQRRQCTSDLKRAPIQKWIRNNAEGLVVSAVGLRAEESPARAKRPAWSLNEELSKSGREVYDWLPIQDWTVGQVLAQLDRHGVTLHWAYQHVSRLSCVICIFSGDDEVARVAKFFPALFERFAMLEEEVGFTYAMDRRTLRERALAGNPDKAPLAARMACGEGCRKD